ncbi:ABC-type branched-subunit amino acid transport system substrate-binding protein [Silvimonas terrae]|uniref:ABC-type branched-subunit amino acid transport system substrate-binding protein n=1 Tax=Silvimonas terrae TaxID=300266 RepID=A0A840RG88_9NEIS|nr:ABC transporter substrate-binding protein [Silvimonas terrae]MBB5191356.1 ABC-type branched-subunit amino acid transport system substrate-binding protein [Silvimonas terrae]
MILRNVLLTLALMTTATSQADINIGESVPTSGLAGDTGKALALGASIYFGRVNAQGGINGEPINLITRDDGYDATRTLANTHDLIEKENAVALIGYYGTTPMQELIKAKLLDNAGIALVGAYSGADSIRTPGSPFFFQTRASYTDEIERIVSLLNDHLGVTRIAVVAQKDGFGEAGYTALKNELAKRKLTLAGEAWYDKTSGDTNSAAQALAKINPEAIVMVAISKPAATFTKQYKALGGTSQLYGLSPIQYDEVTKAVGVGTAHGIGLSQVFPAPTNAQLKLIRDFQKDAEPFLKTGDYPSYALLEGYISARLLTEAIKRAGKNPTRASVYTALSNMRKFDLGGFTVDFTDKRRLGSNFVELTMISPTGTLTR